MITNNPDLEDSGIVAVSKPFGESTSDKCKTLFRISWVSSEAGFQPDLNLVHKMLGLKVRVQDLLDYICDVGEDTKVAEIEELLDYWYTRSKNG